MGKIYKYFTLKEVSGLEKNFVEKLDMVRGYWGYPIIISKNGGYRTPEQNKKAGGVSDSAHIKGLAADIKTPNSKSKLDKLIWAIGMAGISRIGIYDKHLHIDIDLHKPQNVIWYGKSK